MTTYILGAGASLHAGYPLASQPGNELYEWIRKKKSEDDLFRVRIEALYDAYGGLGDLEQILTELDEGQLNSPAGRMGSFKPAHMRQAIEFSIPEFFNGLREQPAPFYDRLARERIREGDAIITFNYDLACERALKEAGLWEISDGYGFPLGPEGIPPSKVQVLKLHGSTNWWGNVFDGNMGFSQMGTTSLPIRPTMFFPQDLEFLTYSKELSSLLRARNPRSAIIPALILLTRHKHFYVQTSLGREWQEFWSDVWTQAEHALGLSERIVIIGYSMPAADQEARELLLKKANRRANISVCCGESSEDIRDEFRNHGFGRVNTPGKGFFVDYLES